MKDMLLIYLLLVTISACNPLADSRGTIQSVENPPADFLQVDSTFDLQGHRGARGLMPENTVPSFKKALDLGVKTLEMDAVVSKDHQLILSHEPFFSATICLDAQGDSIPEGSERKYNIYQLTAEEIEAYDCGSLAHPGFPEQARLALAKPRLITAIQETEAYIRQNQLGTIYYNIETKSSPEGDSVYHPAPEVFVRLLKEAIDSLEIRDRVFIQSFDPRTLQAMHTLDPDLPLVLLLGDAKLLEKGVRSLGFIPQVYSPNYENLDRGLVQKAHKMGMKVIPWTVNQAEDMGRMLRLKVDGLITDYPDRFRTIIGDTLGMMRSE